MNRADGFRIGQSLSREPSRQGMKYMVERNHINVLRREVLRRIAESFPVSYTHLTLPTKLPV